MKNYIIFTITFIVLIVLGVITLNSFKEQSLLAKEQELKTIELEKNEYEKRKLIEEAELLAEKSLSETTLYNKILNNQSLDILVIENLKNENDWSSIFAQEMLINDIEVVYETFDLQNGGILWAWQMLNVGEIKGEFDMVLFDMSIESYEYLIYYEDFIKELLRESNNPAIVLFTEDSINSTKDFNMINDNYGVSNVNFNANENDTTNNINYYINNRLLKENEPVAEPIDLNNLSSLELFEYRVKPSSHSGFLVANNLLLSDVSSGQLDYQVNGSKCIINVALHDLGGTINIFVDDIHYSEVNTYIEDEVNAQILPLVIEFNDDIDHKVVIQYEAKGDEVVAIHSLNIFK